MTNLKSDSHQTVIRLTHVGKMHKFGRKQMSHTNNIKFLTHHSFYSYNRSRLVKCSIPNSELSKNYLLK